MIELTRMSGTKLFVDPKQIAAIEETDFHSRSRARVQLATDGQWYNEMEWHHDIVRLVQAALEHA